MGKLIEGNFGSNNEFSVRQELKSRKPGQSKSMLSAFSDKRLVESMINKSIETQTTLNLIYENPDRLPINKFIEDFRLAAGSIIEIDSELSSRSIQPSASYIASTARLRMGDNDPSAVS